MPTADWTKWIDFINQWAACYNSSLGLTVWDQGEGCCNGPRRIVKAKTDTRLSWRIIPRGVGFNKQTMREVMNRRGAEEQRSAPLLTVDFPTLIPPQSSLESLQNPTKPFNPDIRSHLLPGQATPKTRCNSICSNYSVHLLHFSSFPLHPPTPGWHQSPKT